jgi:crotonobetainyl-CoA:carnitine CoA-transferase CaiB-like acyl-CoA transferase
MSETAAEGVITPLAGLRVLQGSGGIEVAYCAKILADGGADVVVVEPPDGHPLRRRRVAPDDAGGPPSAMFDYLHAGKRSVLDGAGVEALMERGDVLVADSLPIEWAELHSRHPALSAVVITPFGLTGPWRDHASSDLTLQALSGGMAPRGDAARAPLMAGGEPTPWFAGAVAAVALLGVLSRVDVTRSGELLDVSQLEAAHLEHSMYPITYASMAGTPFHQLRGVPVPGIEPTSDGYVGFFVITGQQWLDFCALIGQPEWAEDESLFIAMERRRRSADLTGVIREWTTARTTGEIVEIASLMRIPVAPIGNGRTIPEIDHFVDQEWLVRNPDGFLQPRRPYRFRGEPVVVPRAAPRAEETYADTGWGSTERDVSSRTADRNGGELPLAGVRVADFTAFWAGPLAAQILAGLGAEVVHIEGPRRPDGIRMNTIRKIGDEKWWEWSPLFGGANTDKRAVAIDLSTASGHEIAMRLLATCDVMIENFSPRVVEQLGLGPDVVRAANPRLTVVRMPAFGVGGPWRDRVGFAQTIEQASGLAFLTGYEGESPVMPNGMCDPIAGVHAAIAALIALRQRDATGFGQVVEAPMIGGALNTAAEQVVEYTAYGHLLTSAGNASPFREQLVVRCAGSDQWVAITIPDDAAWAAIGQATGAACGDELEAWCAGREPAEIEALGEALGIPVARVLWAHELIDLPQLIERQFFEELTHPVTGTHPYIAFPVRFSDGPHRWNRTAAPTLGADNVALLTELGYSAGAIDQLRADGVIAQEVASGQSGW